MHLFLAYGTLAVLFLQGCGGGLSSPAQPERRSPSPQTAEGATHTVSAPHAEPERPETRRIELDEHDQITLPSAGVASYSVNGEAISVTVDTTTFDFVISAVSAGSGSLLLLYDDGRQVLYRVEVLGF